MGHTSRCKHSWSHADRRQQRKSRPHTNRNPGGVLFIPHSSCGRGAPTHASCGTFGQSAPSSQTESAGGTSGRSFHSKHAEL